MGDPNTYSSIKNVNIGKADILEEILKDHSNGIEWIATEKVDGANFSFFFKKGEKTVFCKRNGVITEKENFYSYQRATGKYLENVETLGKKLFQDGATIVQLFGELYGGVYPEQKIKDVAPIQRHIYYSPDIEFIAFDIMVDGVYIPYEKMEALCKLHNIPVIPITHRGSLTELLKINPVYESQIYKLHNLTKLENNFAEGWVIRPKETKFLSNGSRVILKIKNAKFDEKLVKSSPLVSDTDPDVKKAVENMASYINQSRLHSVVSKVGIDKTDRMFENKIMGMLIKDAFEDLLTDYEIDKTLHKLIKKKSTEVYRKEIRELIVSL